MQYISYFIGPIIGAIIGYFTNFIAVKMLFFPKREIYIFGKVLPFTPGAIPKGKHRLARGIGKIVSKNLVTTKAITDRLLDKESREQVLGEIKKFLHKSIREDLLAIAGEEEQYQRIRDGIKNHMSESMLRAIQKMDVGHLISEEAKNVIKERTQGSMLSMFINDRVLKNITDPIYEETEKFIENKAPIMLEKEVDIKLSKLEEESLWDFIAKAELGEEKIEIMIADLYTEAVKTGVEHFIKNIDVYRMVENKINEMSVEELEALVLSIMKKELDTIVNLGAVIGFILGLLNLL